MRRVGFAGLWIALTGCQPVAWPEPDPVCPAEAPLAGEVVVAEIECGEQLPGGSDARTADTWMANSELRAVLRHPQDALTLRGVGGFTLVDIAPWDLSERIHEAVPVVGGGWLEIAPATITYGADALSFEGIVRPLPDLPPPEAEGERRSVRWVLPADVPWIEFEGAEGLWMHAEGDAVLTSGVLTAGGVSHATDGVATDLGGAVLFEGATRLIVAPQADIWELLPGPHQHISGTAPGATALSLLEEGVEVGRVPLTGDSFDLAVPASVDGVRAETGGRAPSATVAPGEGLDLPVGERGAIVFEVAWDGRPREIELSWTGSHGRSGRRLLPASGGSLSPGPGVYDLVLRAGPAWEEHRLHVELDAGETRRLGLSLVPRFDPGAYVSATLDQPSDRSRDWRGSDVTAAQLAVGAGHDFAVFTPEDESAGVSSSASMPSLTFQSGSSRDGDGWRMTAWPFGGGDKKNLRGGVLGDYPDPRDALAAMWGGPKNDRLLRVDLGWLEQVGAPPTLPIPAFVALDDPPDADGAAWAPWLDWLDAGYAVVPTGPHTWVPVADPELLGVADVEQPLIRGDVCASTGPLLTLTVDGAAPGEIAERPPPSASDVTRAHERLAVVSLLGGEALDHLVLLTDGGHVAATLPIEEDGPTEARVSVRADGRWILALAWSDDGEGWAVTGPVWTRAP